MDLPEERQQVVPATSKALEGSPGRPDRPLAELLLNNGNGGDIREADMFCTDRRRDRSWVEESDLGMPAGA